jgi:ABC-type antimicrobial peptide transport system permease subunit
MNQEEKFFPPHWPLKILRFFIKRDYLEEIEGDMEEYFKDYVEASGSITRARLAYCREVLLLLRPVLLKKFTSISPANPIPMFRNYYKTSFRGLMKNPLTSFINVFGLAVAIGITLVVYAFLEYDFSIDQYHANKKEIYLATFTSERDGVVQQYGKTPRPLGEILKNEFAEVERMSRVEDRSAVVKFEDNVFHEQIRFADADFLQMFTFPLKWGSPSALGKSDNIILSHDMSTKYFGNEDPVGREMSIIFSDSIKKVFTVGGVAKEFPKAHDIEFNCLINFDNIETAEPGYVKEDWSKFVSATIVQVGNPLEMGSIHQKLERYRLLQNQAQPDWAISSFQFEPLLTLHERAHTIKGAIVNDYNVEGRIGMPVIAVFMIILACFNYINIAVVSAAKRIKEIGVRKVIGASRVKVIIQFLTENMAVTSFALAIGLALSFFVFLPWFVQFTGWPLELRLLNMNLWIFLVALMLFTGIASGIYPAFYISKFEAVKIFRGSLEFGKRNPLTKIFLGIQLVLACVTITAGVVFTQNNDFQNKRSWGYDQKSALYIAVPDERAFSRIKASVSENPQVTSISGSSDHIGKKVSSTLVTTISNQSYEVDQFAVDATYAQTMGIEMKEGRFFREQSESDRSAIVVNEVFVQKLNIGNPLGQSFIIDSMKYEVIGVVKDFHTKNFFNKVEPSIFKLADERDYRFLTIRVKKESSDRMLASLKTEWAKLYPEIPFQGGHQEDVWSSYFYSVNRSERFNKVIAAIAVLLASLGLYGLVTLNVSGRVKEFSIRKTLGAGIKQMSTLIFKQYALLIICSLVIGAPVSYIFTKAYLDMLFAYPMPMSYSGVVIAIILLIFILIAVISTQIKKVVKLNPVDGLKVE